MINLRINKKNLIQIIAITELNLKLKLRFKFTLIINYITPIIMVFMPIIVLNKFFDLNTKFGTWTEETYLVFLCIAYQIFLIRNIISDFPLQIRLEKFWKTLPSLIIAPFSRFNFLIGILISHLVSISIPFIIFLIISYIFYPISIFTLLFILGIFSLIELIFCGIGLVLGIFAVSNENIWRILVFLINLILFISCISYPYEIFPNSIQRIIDLNPFYYIFDILRNAWIEDNIFITISLHTLNLYILIIISIIFPALGIKVFNYIYKRYGIVGY